MAPRLFRSVASRSVESYPGASLRRSLQSIPLQALFVVPFALQTVLAVGITGALAWYNGQRAVNELVIEVQREMGDRIQLKISQYLDQPILATRLNAEAAAAGQLPIRELEQAEPQLFRRLQQFKDVSGLLIANAEGDARAVNRRDGLNLLSRDQRQDSRHVTEYRLNVQGERQALRQTFAAPDVRRSDWYRSAVEAGGLTWSPIFQTIEPPELGETSRPDLSLNASMPVYDETQTLLGVVSSGIVLSVISEFLYSLDVSPNGGVFIVDQLGQLIASSSPSQPLYPSWQPLTHRPTENFPKLEQIQAHAAEDPLIRETAAHVLATYGSFEQAQAGSSRFRGSSGRQFVKLIPSSNSLGLNWWVVVVVPERDFMAQINRNSRTTLALSGLALLGSIGMGLVTSRFLSRSILRLSRATQAIAQGDLEHQVNEDSPIREVTVVAQSFNQMSEQLKNSFAELETQVEARTLELQQAFDFEQTLKGLTDKVRDSLDERQILQTAVEDLAIAIGVRGCNAAIYDLEQQRSVIQYEYTRFPKRLQGRQLQMQNFAGYRQLLQGQHFQHCGLILAPSRGRVAMLACPMQDDQGILGDLWLIKPASDAFNEREIRLVQQVANQCAIAIRQARLYQAAQAQVSELERLNRLKDDFLSTVSHELRTPIANMKMALQMLEIGLTRAGILEASAQSPVQRYFEILKDECQRESRLIENLLDLSRLTADSQPLTQQELPHPTAWLHQIIQPYREQAEEKQQRWQSQIPARLPPLHTDSAALERILSELLNNACKYSPAGEAITFQVILPDTHETREAHEIRFEVKNSGIEIPPTEQERVFERFYRIPTDDPWKHGGTGLGLALVQSLVEQLGGQIELWSEQNQTCFAVRLAIAQPISDPSHSDSSQPADPTHRQPSPQ